MRRAAVAALIIFTLAGCGGSEVVPLGLESGSQDSSGSRSPGMAGADGPLTRPSAPPAGDPNAPTTTVQSLEDLSPQAPPTPLFPEMPEIGDFCADHLEPARVRLDAAEQAGRIDPADLAVVQSVLDTALQFCTPDEYFAFQQQMFAFFDPDTARNAPPAVEPAAPVG
jgi:hypothetical protein